MSMFYCSSCDHLVDSDLMLFVYDDVTMDWTCENCLDADPDLDQEKILYQFNSGQDRSTFHGDDEDYGGYSHRYDEPFSDRGATDE